MLSIIGLISTARCNVKDEGAALRLTDLYNLRAESVSIPSLVSFCDIDKDKERSGLTGVWT